jgi:outer membrane lipoprotein-sorting protein
LDGGGRTGTLGRMLRRLAVIPLLFVAAAAAWADNLGHEVARRHAERADGAARRLRSLYAEGRTLIGGEVVAFRLWAARPSRLRVESVSPVRRVVQVHDGRHEPFISHSDIQGGRPMRMAPEERRDFLFNADFDGPLVDFALKGCTVDYAGEEAVDGRPAAKLLVMNANDDVMFYWVDAATSEVVKRRVYRLMEERRSIVDTLFSDFRRVGGALQPHRIETQVDGRTLYVIEIVRMEADAEEVREERFAVPTGWPRLAMVVVRQDGRRVGE